jgi:hypothetical protein
MSTVVEDLTLDDVIAPGGMMVMMEDHLTLDDAVAASNSPVHHKWEVRGMYHEVQQQRAAEPTALADDEPLHIEDW